GFFGSLWALWEAQESDGKLRLVLRNRPNPLLSLEPTAAVDVDGDGTVEILFQALSNVGQSGAKGRSAYLYMTPGRLCKLRDIDEDIRGLQIPILGCSC